MQALPDRAPGRDPAQSMIYTAFGLRVEADPSVDMTGLGLTGGSSWDGPATRIRIDREELEGRWAAVGGRESRVRELRQGGSAVFTVDLAESAGYLLQAEGLGRMLVVSDGSEVLCDPQAGDLEWEFLLPAQVLPLVATLYGFEVLHAGGLVVGESAVLFSGAPGAGKSSLVAALLRRGAALLSDDCVAMEQRAGRLVAHPGAGVLYLRHSESERLSVEERSVLGTSVPFAGKQRFGFDPAAPAPFGALFLLERAVRGPAIEPIEDVDPFDLLAATFNLSVRTPKRLIRQLDVVEALIESGRVYRLRVLPGIDATQLSEMVEQHLIAEFG